jgi:hypothetical protein
MLGLTSIGKELKNELCRAHHAEPTSAAATLPVWLSELSMHYIMGNRAATSVEYLLPFSAAHSSHGN